MKYDYKLGGYIYVMSCDHRHAGYLCHVIMISIEQHHCAIAINYCHYSTTFE